MTERRFPLRLDPAAPAEAANRWTLRRWFAVGATVLGVLSLIAIALGSWAVTRIGMARDVLYDQVAPAVTAGQSVTSAQLSQQTGVRGFTIVPNDEFLQPYVQGRADQDAAVARLRAAGGEIVSDRLDTALDEVVATTERWRTEYAEPTIAAARAGTERPDPELGLALFDQARGAAAELNDDLMTERLEARGRLDAAITFVAVVGITISVIAAVFLLLASLGLRNVILRPLRRLAGQTRAVVAGDVGLHVEGSGPREIVSLGADVEAMRSHIQREVDELQVANEKLDAQTRDLERSNRDLEQFAYVASHDLQEPLRKVSSFCQLLQRRYGGQLDDRADQYIAFAVDGAQRMQALINDLLSFSRVGRSTAGFEPVDLGAAARLAVAQLASAVEDSGGRIEIPEDLPVVSGDPGLLQALLVNLFGNGLKFRREDVPPVVWLGALRRDREWEISVADNGIGIEPQFVDKIFVIFQRLHGRDVYAGTGIGLALAKKIVEFHGGRIWVEHTDPGTTFHLTLPALSAATTVTAKEPVP